MASTYSDAAPLFLAFQRPVNQFKRVPPLFFLPFGGLGACAKNSAGDSIGGGAKNSAGDSIGGGFQAEAELLAAHH